MKLMDIPLRKPTFGEVTAAAVMACGLWIAALGLIHVLDWPLKLGDAGALLLVATWGCLSVRMGIEIGRGQRHLVVHLLVSATLLGVYEAVRSVVA